MPNEPQRRGGATLTRLGRAVRTAGGPARPAEPQHREEHRQANWLRDVILGGQDGLVNILGIILGVIAGGGSIATLIGHLIPLLPFVWLPRTPALITAIVLSAGVLFGVGVYSSVTLVGDWRKNGLKMVTIGLGAAAAGFLIGRLFHTAGA